MIQLLRVNNPIMVLFSIFVSLVLHILVVFHPFDTTFVLKHSEPLSFIVFSWLNDICGDAFFYVLCLLGCAVQIVQAILINNILNDFKIIPKRSYLGGLIFILCSSFDPQWLLFSPQQISLLLLIPILYLTFTLSRQERFYTQLFDLGFFASLSALFYFPSAFFLILIFPALYSVRSFNFNEFLRILVGIFTPLFVVVSVAYLNDSLPYLWNWIINKEHQQRLTFDYFNPLNTALIALNGGWLLISIILFTIVSPSLSMQARKMIGTVSISVVLLIIFSIVPTWLSNAYWLPASITSTFFLVIVLSEMRNELLANIIFALLLISAVVPTILS